MTSALLRGTCSSLPSCHPRLRLLQKFFGTSECQSCGLILRLRLIGLPQRPRSSRRQARQGCRNVGVSSDPGIGPMTMKSWPPSHQGCAQFARCLVLNAFAQAIGDVPSVDSTTTRPRRIARTTGAWFRRVPQCHVRRRRSGRPRHLSLALPLLGVTAAGSPGPSVGSRMIGSAPGARTTTMPASRLSQQSVVQGGSGFACEVCIDMPFAHCWGLGLETWIHV